jgi:outer membrane protein TolC
MGNYPKDYDDFDDTLKPIDTHANEVRKAAEAYSSAYEAECKAGREVSKIEQMFASARDDEKRAKEARIVAERRLIELIGGGRSAGVGEAKQFWPR